MCPPLVLPTAWQRSFIERVYLASLEDEIEAQPFCKPLQVVSLDDREYTKIYQTQICSIGLR